MNYLKTLASGLAASTIAITAGQSAQAQITSSDIRGRVLDDAGNGVSGAAVTIVHVPTGTTSTATSSPGGTFFASGLRVGGPYDITISTADGASERENIFLQPSSNTLTFNVEDVRTLETIIVRGEVGTGLEINNGIGSVFTNEDILNQPSVQRDLIATLVRDPLAASSGEGNLSIAGSNPRFNGLAIDGALLQDDFGLSSSTYPTSRSPINLDAIESASVVASDYSVKAAGFTGGLVNVITKSGTNDFEGTAFYYRRDEDFTGNTAFDTFNDVPAFLEEEYGFTLGGPIIEDKLFFFVSYDEFETASGRNFTSEDEIDGFQPGLFDALNDLIIQGTGIDSGGRPTLINVPETSERLLAKIDWNINQNHRAFFSYQSTEEDQLTSISQTEFQTAWYQAPQELEVYTAQVNSDWTDRLSTEFRINFKDNFRGQDCGLPGTGELSIRLSEADLVGTSLEGLIDDGDGTIDERDTFFTAGCDRFRHANVFEDERLQFFGAANYVLGDHLITFGAEYEDYELFNLFVERSNGRFIFDTVDDLVNGNATVSYRNDITNDANNAAAAWSYNVFTAFAQDSWQIRPDFRLDYGIRYQYYSQDDAPQESAAFEETYGRNSSNNLDGLDLFLPRVGFEYTPFERTRITGGFGLFAGAEPKVWISNAFQPFVGSADGEFTNVDPTTVPQQLLDEVAASDFSQLLPIDVIASDFEIPSDWKASVKLEQEFDLNLPFIDLGSDYVFTAQYLRSEVNDGYLWTNLAQTELAETAALGVAPDGRPIYADLQDLGISNVTQLGNFSDGSSDVFSVALANEYDNGVGFFISYANQSVESVTPGTSSRGISNFRAIVDSDRNNPSAATGEFEIEHAFKLNLSYEKEVFGDLESLFTLFGQVNSGTPFSYTFDVDGNNALFGRPGDFENPFDNDLLYIPTISGAGFNDPSVVFSSDFDQTGFRQYINARGLTDGAISERNGDNSPWSQRWDFQYQQELPIPTFSGTPFDDHNLRFVVDIENVGNLLNDEWGTDFNGPSNFTANIVEADLVSAADVAANGVDGATALTGDAPRTTCLSAGDCVYRYNDFDADPSGFEDDANSVYTIRVGIRYQF